MAVKFPDIARQADVVQPSHYKSVTIHHISSHYWFEAELSN